MAKGAALEVEQNGLNVIPESERHGKPSGQFWPWAASNISIFGISMAGWIFGFGLNFGQLTAASLIGIVFSFALVGIIALAGKRGSAPTMVISRAAFGFFGNAVPSVVSYLLLVGWEIALVALGVLASNTVMAKLGWSWGTDNFFGKLLAFVVLAGFTVLSGVWGFKLIMRIQRWITVAGVTKNDAPGGLTAAADPAYAGKWKGIIGGPTCNLLVLRWTHVEFAGFV